MVMNAMTQRDDHLNYQLKYGKLGIINPCKIYDPEYYNIRMLTQEGSQPLKHQHLIDDVNQNKMREMKTDPIE